LAALPIKKGDSGNHYIEGWMNPKAGQNTFETRTMAGAD